jgi:formylglycine-generating enzyme required for sulfatase activity
VVKQFRLAQSRAESLLQQIDRLEARRRSLRPDLPALISTPLMARLALIVHSYAEDLPAQRAELFMKAVQALLSADYEPEPGASAVLAAEVGGSWETHRDLLRELALAWHTAGRQEATRNDVQNALPSPHTAALLGFADARGDVLQGHLGRYKFMHLALQESLAACQLAARHSPPALAQFLLSEDRVTQPWWREVAFLAAGYFVAPTNTEDRDEAKLGALLQALAQGGANPALPPATRFAAAELVGRITEELFKNDAAPFAAAQRAQASQALAALFEDDAALHTAPAKTRAALGDVLGQLGDPRPHATTVDAMRLCWVPRGRFLMGSTADDDLAYDDETCNGEVTACEDFVRNGIEVPHDFWIGQHPISNAQFDEFVCAGGYADGRWWTVAKQAGVWREGKVKHRFVTSRGKTREEKLADWQQGNVEEAFEEVSRPAALALPASQSREALLLTWDDVLRERPNHPVANISWYEALAFCAWLTERWRKQGWLSEAEHVTLPTEPEWEKAARGGFLIPARPIVRTPSQQHAAETMDTSDWLDNPQPRRRYAWGEDFSTHWANTLETALDETTGKTSALGCFANGHSPYGCHDMCGNVLEWTRSLYGLRADIKKDARLDFAYPYDAEDGREALDAEANVARVLRGGSWDDDLQGARVAFRYWTPPDYRNSLCGFRVVCAPVFPPVPSENLFSEILGG